MNIIKSCGSKSWGGLEMQAMVAAEALMKKGHNVTLFCPQDSTIEQESIKRDIRTLPFFQKGIERFKMLSQFKRILKDGEIDIIHTHLSHDLGALVWALRRTRSNVPLILTRAMGSGVSKKDIYHRYIYKRVDRIFALSNFVRDSILDTFPVNRDKVTILPYALGLDDFNSDTFNKVQIKNELGCDNNKIIIGFAGRFTPLKGLKELLLAGEIIKNKIDIPFQLLIVGSASYGEETYEREIRQMAEQLYANDEIIFAGFRKEIPKMMSAMDIFVVPSHEEAFGMVLLEAMAMKLPIAASNSGGIPDIIINNNSGLLFQPKNPQNLAEVLISMIKNKNLRDNLASAARKRVEEVYSFPVYIDSLENCYSELIELRARK